MYNTCSVSSILTGLPGGMLCKIEDRTIVDTSLREMNEEIAGLPENVQVLGKFCWSS